MYSAGYFNPMRPSSNLLSAKSASSSHQPAYCCHYTVQIIYAQLFTFSKANVIIENLSFQAEPSACDHCLISPWS